MLLKRPPVRVKPQRGEANSVPDNLSYVPSWTAYFGIEEYRPRRTALDTTNERVRGRHGVRREQARREGLPSGDVLLIDSSGVREHFLAPGQQKLKGVRY